MEGDEEPSFNEEQAPPPAAVFANGDNASRDRHDTSTSNASEEWKTKSAKICEGVKFDLYSKAFTCSFAKNHTFSLCPLWCVFL